MNAPEPYRVLFVCLGNICRSPAAEIIFKKMVAEQGLEHLVESDSAGMIGYHRGCPPDSRMLTALKTYGYEDPGLKSRPVRKEDLEQFDLIVGMDRENLRDLKRLDKKGQWTGKIVPMCFFTTRFPDEEVPDPYYGGQEGFEHVVKLLQDGCGNLLERLKEQLSL
jgi:protein-tyrosine phosphatase